MAKQLQYSDKRDRKPDFFAMAFAFMRQFYCRRIRLLTLMKSSAFHVVVLTRVPFSTFQQQYSLPVC